MKDRALTFAINRPAQPRVLFEFVAQNVSRCQPSAAGYRDVGRHVHRDHMGKNSVEIHVVANGFNCISTFSIWWCIWLRVLLTFRYGFWRKGPWIPAVTDEAVYPEKGSHLHSSHVLASRRLRRK